MNEQIYSSIYLHFPFCETKCHYCDFFSLPEAKVELDQRARVYRAIYTELLRAMPKVSQTPRTIFLGGGTPSLVPIDALASTTSLLGGAAEFTIEANPSSITLEKARLWKTLGINRISMGVQALNDDRLQWLGRIHNVESIYRALDAISEAGIPRVTIDYILGVPEQSLGMIESELSKLLKTYPQIQHLSAYLLTLKNSNPKFSLLPNEDEQLAHLRFATAFLADQGFEHYEISNYARSGARALHNENYWLGGSYLGVGPSAHGFNSVTKTRWKNWASLGKYCELIESNERAAEFSEIVNEESSRNEFLLLRLRRREGFLLSEYSKRFHGHDFLIENKAWIERLTEKGLCVLDGDKFALTSEGFFLSDQILSMLK